MKRFVTAILIAVVLIQHGCSGRSTSPYASPTEADRDTQSAQELTQQAVERMPEDVKAAEELLREALAADLFYGPAHNDLGVIHLKQGNLYAAASEFEWARKLMPGHPDPRMNLGLTLERAGRVDEALATYDAALEVYPNHLPTIQAICRCQLRYDRPDTRTDEFLKEIALRGETDLWRTWAREQMIRREP